MYSTVWSTTVQYRLGLVQCTAVHCTRVLYNSMQGIFDRPGVTGDVLQSTLSLSN